MQKYKKMDSKEVQSKKKEKEKELRIKITHVLAKIFHKREIYFREHSRIRLATKYPHTYTSSSKSMTLLSLDPGLDFTIHKISMLHTLSLPELHISFLEVG